MIRTLISFTVFSLFLTGCSSEPKALDIGLITSTEDQKAIVWVNDEPIKVIEPNSGGVVPVVLASQKGENRFWVTTESSTESSEYFTEVKILEGSYAKPDEIKTHFKWESKKEKDKSPIFKYFEKTGYRMNISEFEDLDINDDEMIEIVKKMLTRIEAGLNKRDLGSCGISSERMDLLMKSAFDVDNYEEQVFGCDSYEVSKICAFEDLEFIKGKKTIFAYNPSGENIFKAGPKQVSDGKMRYSFTLQSLSIAKENGTWKLVY